MAAAYDGAPTRSGLAAGVREAQLDNPLDLLNQQDAGLR